jgi:hypothetical protein
LNGDHYLQIVFTDPDENVSPVYADGPVTISTGYVPNIVDTQGTASLTVPAAALPDSTEITISLMMAGDVIGTDEYIRSNRLTMKKFGAAGFSLLFKRDGTNTKQYEGFFNSGTLSNDPATPTHVHIQASFGATSGDEGDSFVNVYIDGVLTPPDSGGLETGEAWGAIWLDLATTIGNADFYIGNVFIETGAAHPIGDFYDGGPKDLTSVGSPQVLVNGTATDWNVGTNSGSVGTLTVNSATFVDA